MDGRSRSQSPAAKKNHTIVVHAPLDEQERKVVVVVALVVVVLVLVVLVVVDLKPWMLYLSVVVFVVEHLLRSRKLLLLF